MPIGHDQIHLCCPPTAQVLEEATPPIFVAPGAQARNARMSLFPSRSTLSAVKMMVESVWVPCRTLKWISVLRRGYGSGGGEDVLATLHIVRSTFGWDGSPRWVQPPSVFERLPPLYEYWCHSQTSGSTLRPPPVHSGCSA